MYLVGKENGGEWTGQTPGRDWREKKEKKQENSMFLEVLGFFCLFARFFIIIVQFVQNAKYWMSIGSRAYWVVFGSVVARHACIKRKFAVLKQASLARGPWKTGNDLRISVVMSLFSAKSTHLRRRGRKAEHRSVNFVALSRKR